MIRKAIVTARAALFSYFGTYHRQRAEHYRKLVELLERDVVAAARSEGEALDQVRSLQRQLEQQRLELMRYRNKVHNLLAPQVVAAVLDAKGQSDIDANELTDMLEQRVSVDPCGHIVAPGFVCVLEPDHDGDHYAPTSCAVLNADHGVRCRLEAGHDGKHWSGRVLWDSPQPTADVIPIDAQR
jgi:hypothetical protein